MADFFADIAEPTRYQGPNSDNPLAFRWYDAERTFASEAMTEHLRLGLENIVARYIEAIT